MSRFQLFLLVAAAWLAASCREAAEAPPAEFDVEVLNAFTPVKDQGSSPSCWAYAMLAAIETEHIMRGDSVHLSADYAVRAYLADAYRRCYLAGGEAEVSPRGTAMALIGTIMQYGLVTYDACHGSGGANTEVLARKLGRLAAMEARRRAGFGGSGCRLGSLLDENLGPVPRKVFMYGAEYTPQEFARSVCAPGEYVGLTSFTHHPFYTDFALEVPDNRRRDLFTNVPVDTLVAVMERAVRAGRGVCWEGDTSEPGFSFGRGVATLPEATPATQADRQRAFERFDTTDDHCMAVVGLARDAKGRRFFIMKNSWGTKNPFGGLMYLSEDYVRLKTIAVVVPREEI